MSFVSNLVLIVGLSSNRQDDITSLGRQPMQFEFENVRMAYSTVADAQTKYHVPQFGHWNQENADT